ncbi:hypothetical protein LIER_34598 [Lithospermum erythrorhizon]|uniref:Uncharacterized protein n=1 Tax=Lithospermum erythrorhizon TaxID=34254 RepID=A0AAV3S300_LITER
MQSQGSLPPTNPVRTATPVGASGHSTTMALELEDHGEVGSETPQVAPSSFPPVLGPQAARLPSSPPEGLPASKKRSPTFPAQDSLVSKRSVSGLSHAELISSFFALVDKFFDHQGVLLQSYLRLLSSYEEASGSSSRVGPLEHDLKALKKEKAQEERALQRRLKNLTGEHSTL